MRALRRATLSAPTLDEGYDWPHVDAGFEPYKNQKVTSGFLSFHRRAWCCNGLRSGKTYAATYAEKMLREVLVHTGRTLVLAPLGVCPDWEEAFSKIDTDQPAKRIYDGSDRTLKQVQKEGLSDDVDILILNHHKLDWLVRDIDAWLGHASDSPALIIADEASVFKNHLTDRYKCLEYLVKDCKAKEPRAWVEQRFLWALTGSPRARDATNVWAVSRLINPALMHYTFNEWRSKVQRRTDIRDKFGKYQFSTYTDKKDAPSICAEYMQPMIRFRTQDCVDLPPQAYQYFWTPADGDQKRLLSAFGNRLRTATADGHTFNALKAGSRLNKLMQVASGVVRNKEGDWVEIGCKHRINQLLSLYEEAEGNVIVFCTYKATARYLQKQLKKKKIKTGIINGDIPPSRRRKVKDEFQNGRRKMVLIMHPEPTRFGYTMSAASITVWWEPPMDPEHWLQGNERGRGPKTHKTLIAMFYSSEAERHYYEVARARTVNNNKTIDLFAEFAKSRVKLSKELASLIETDEAA